MKRRGTTSRRGLTLVELMIALTITLVIGAALAAVLTTISRVTEHDRDTRTASLRAHAVQIRLQAYSDSGMCVLQTDGKGDFVIWLEDADSGGSVNPTEVRVFTIENDGRLLCEWYDPPEAFTPEELEVADAPVPAATDFFTLMKTYRAARQTQQAVIADGLTGASVSHDTAAPIDATRVRYAFQQTFPSGTSSDSLIALAFQQHTTPEF